MNHQNKSAILGNMQKVIIYGGSGFIGSRLVPALERQGYFVVICDRVAPSFSYQGEFVSADIMQPLAEQWNHEGQSYLSNPYAVINLAGKNIFGKFTPEHKQAILDSRVIGTRMVIDTFQEPRFKPRVYITASAVGYYGDRPGEQVSEQTAMGNTFLAQVVSQWEGVARHVETMGIRMVIFRQGNIIGAGGLASVLQPYYMKGIGGPIGSGSFYFPWMHIEDVIEYYIHALADTSVRGMYNLVAGNPITYKQFSQAFARALKKPHIFFIPKFLLTLKFGEFTDEITVDQKITPQRVLTIPHVPLFTDIHEALEYQVGK